MCFSAPSHESLAAEQEYAPNRLQSIQMTWLQTRVADKACKAKTLSKTRVELYAQMTPSKCWSQSLMRREQNTRKSVSKVRFSLSTRPRVRGRPAVEVTLVPS